MARGLRALRDRTRAAGPPMNGQCEHQTHHAAHVCGACADGEIRRLREIEQVAHDYLTSTGIVMLDAAERLRELVLDQPEPR